jgi:hypothetical protein
VGRIGEIAAQVAQEQAMLAMAPGDDRFDFLHKGADVAHIEGAIEGLQQKCEKGTQVADPLAERVALWHTWHPYETSGLVY